MRLLVVIAIVMLPFSAFSAASERPVDSAECKDITARLIETTNGRLDHFDPMGFDLFVQTAEIKTIVLTCTSHRMTGIKVSWEQNGFPPNTWFTVISKAGAAVTGVDPKKLETAVRKCHRAALKKTEFSEVEIPNAKIECSADASGVYMSVWINDHEARKGIEEH
jgi:hypothetical protein